MSLSFIESPFSSRVDYERWCALSEAEQAVMLSNFKQHEIQQSSVVSETGTGVVAQGAKTVFKLVGLQALHKRAITKGEPTRGELLQELCEPMLDAARNGKLRAADASLLLSGAIVENAEAEEVRALAKKRKLPSILRFLFTSKVSWAMFTVEWLDALADFLAGLGLQGKRVLEVCAGENTLSAPMRERGFEWLATDVTIRETAVAPPIQRGALDAVRQYAPHAVFWSWWSEGATLMSDLPEAEAVRMHAADNVPAAEDRLLVEMCMASGVPAIFVGEGRGGVTGSASFWAGPWRPTLLADVVEGFPDVPNWEGQHDRSTPQSRRQRLGMTSLHVFACVCTHHLS